MAHRSANTDAAQASLPTRSDTNAIVPAAVVTKIAPVDGRRGVVASERFAKLIPRRPTGREKEVGREAAYRVAVQEGHRRLEEAATAAVADMHDYTHRALVAGVCTMNARTRAVADDADRAEIAAITAEQKAMFIRHQLGVLEAGSFRVAAEVDRPLYAESRGALGRLLGE
jgi:hypothetical protein